MNAVNECWSDCLARGNDRFPGMDPESRMQAYQIAIDLFIDRARRAIADDTRAAQVLLNDTRRVQRLRHKSPNLELIK